MNKLTKKELFNLGVDKIKSFGYKCFQPKGNEEYTYCKITDGINIGYMQI